MAIDTLSNLQNQAKNSIAEAATKPISFGPTSLEQSQKMAQATTGKESAGVPGAAVSNIAEQVAGDQLAEQQKQLQQQAGMAERQQQTAEEEQYLQLQDQELDYRSKGIQIKQEFNSQLSKLLQDFKEKGDDLSLDKSRAAAEQIGALTRLQNDKYVSELKINGAKRRLTNKKEFADAALESQFSNQLTLLQDDFKFRSLIKANDREFSVKLAEMGFDDALALLDSEMEGNKEAMLWRGIGGLAEAGIQAAAKYEPEETVQDYRTDTEVSGTNTTGPAPIGGKITGGGEKLG